MTELRASVRQVVEFSLHERDLSPAAFAAKRMREGAAAHKARQSAGAREETAYQAEKSLSADYAAHEITLRVTGRADGLLLAADGARIVEKYAPVYDILLLDIEMKEMDGMAAARRIRERDDNVVIIFITAAPQYAISGYEVRALSYLLKPLPWFAFSQELKKSIDMVRRNGDDSMLIETGKGQMRMNLTDILYLESIRHTIVIHTLDGKYSINGTLKDMEAKLADRHFFRSNSCYLVNLKHVTGVADQDCIMSDDERLRVSRPRKKAFLAALADYMGGGR